MTAVHDFNQRPHQLCSVSGMRSAHNSPNRSCLLGRGCLRGRQRIRPHFPFAFLGFISCYFDYLMAWLSAFSIIIRIFHHVTCQASPHLTYYFTWHDHSSFHTIWFFLYFTKFPYRIYIYIFSFQNFISGSLIQCGNFEYCNMQCQGLFPTRQPMTLVLLYMLVNKYSRIFCYIW